MSISSNRTRRDQSALNESSPLLSDPYSQFEYSRKSSLTPSNLHVYTHDNSIGSNGYDSSAYLTSPQFYSSDVPIPDILPGSWDEFWRDFKIRLRYYIPIVGWLPKYDVSVLQADIIAGITVAFLIIPQSLSYAQALVKIPAIYGLYSAFIPLLFYSMLGTSRQLAVGPEALVSILVGSTIKEFVKWKETIAPVTELSLVNSFADIDDTLTSTLKATSLLCLMVGIFTFSLGFFRLGFLDSVLSRALLRGFVLAVAMVVIIDMFETLFGLVPPTGQCQSSWPTSITGVAFEDFPTAPPSSTGDSESPMWKLWEIIYDLPKSHVLTTVISSFSITFLLVVKRVKSYYKSIGWIQLFPEILVLVLSSTIFSWVLRWDCQGVAILNAVSGNATAVDTLPVPTFAKIKYLLLSSILISVIGFVESIVVAKTYATQHNYAVSPNRELVALGMSNIISSLFGGFPAFGSLGRSAVNDGAGARSQIAGFVTGLIVWITSIWLLPYFKFLPKAVCSSIIVVAALKLIELEEVFFIIKLHAWKDFGLLMLTFLTTLFISIESGTLISVGVSLLLVVKHTTKTRLAIVGQTWVIDPQSGQVKTKFRSAQDHGESIPIQSISGGLIIRFEEGMFFGNVGQLRDRLKRIEVYGDLGVHPGEEPRRKPKGRSNGNGENPFQQQRQSNGALLESDFVSELESLSDEGAQDPDDESIRSVVFDMSSVTDIDASAVQTLLEIVEDYKSRGVIVCFVKLRENCKDLFDRAGIYTIVGHQHFFRKIRDAVEYLQAANVMTPAGVSTSHSGTIPQLAGSPSLQVVLPHAYANGALGLAASQTSSLMGNHSTVSHPSTHILQSSMLFQRSSPSTRFQNVPNLSSSGWRTTGVFRSPVMPSSSTSPTQLMNSPSRYDHYGTLTSSSPSPSMREQDTDTATRTSVNDEE